jgi:hypothetical protein
MQTKFSGFLGFEVIAMLEQQPMNPQKLSFPKPVKLWLLVSYVE